MILTARRIAMVAMLMAIGSSSVRADDLADQIRKLDPIVLTPPKDDPDHYRNLLPRKISAELKEANAKSTREWRAIGNLEEWEAFSKTKMDAMRSAIGRFPDPRPPEALKAQTTKTLDGEGFKIECLVFESRPRFLVTANLYRPDPLPASCPGIIIHPSHHNPKTQGELQDMGMTWARAGCYVLVMDQVGHGERRAHPFATEADYAKPFRAGRQDYWFRYNTGMQLALIGDSLIGWQAYDLMRGVDLLLTRERIDKDRIIMMGSVAGGGDPVAVTAALDERIACAVVFNFGGPQPETKYPLPADAEETFNYAGSGSWESTRNMAFSARDGFLPWVIVGSIAPRRLVYAHEFAWDKERDPVWKRLEKIYAWHGKPEHLSFTFGYGSVRESGDKASHCNNIGAVHRKQIYPALKKWFDIPEPKEEYTKRRPGAELLALTPEVVAERKPLMLHEAAKAESLRRQEKPSAPLRASAEDTAMVIRAGIGSIFPGHTVFPSQYEAVDGAAEALGDAAVYRTTLRIDGVVVPYLLIVPKVAAEVKPPVAILIAQEGKAALLKDRSDGIAALLKAQVAVCLPDARGTGETRLDRSRGRNSWDSSISASAHMLGKPMLLGRLRDMRAVVTHLQSRPEVDAQRLLVWGDSLAPINGPKAAVQVPFDAPDAPVIAEPAGPLLALLLGLYERDMKAVYVRGALASSDSVLASSFVHLPHDAIIPRGAGAESFAAFGLSLAGTPLRWEAAVNALNQIDGSKWAGPDIERSLNLEVRDKAGSAAVEFSTEAAKQSDVAAWLVERLKK